MDKTANGFGGIFGIPESLKQYNLDTYLHDCETVSQQVINGIVSEAEGNKCKAFLQSEFRKFNSMIRWPEEWTDYNYNGIKEPCDMLRGICSCGAWHSLDEDWVAKKLKEHGVKYD